MQCHSDIASSSADLEHGVAVRIRNVDLQTSKFGSIIVTEIKRFDSYTISASIMAN